MFKKLVLKNRSYRRFYGNFNISRNTLAKLIDLARLSPSAANLQPLKYVISCGRKKNALIFPYLKWAGYLKDWAGPEENERPSAYILILGDTKITKNFDADCGIAAQSILLGATALGLGGCMIGSIDREGLRKSLDIARRYEIRLVIAIGRPKERVILKTIGKEGNIKYWRDAKGIHHVPKRRLEDIILG
ncbi:MAG: nitroreductase family protein [Candidatus Omnitrophica bacterium]|nr:nitroreductase family protein [Candidatus Omnitrophota bacterium]